jgi:hypothetical protein
MVSEELYLGCRDRCQVNQHPTLIVPKGTTLKPMKTIFDRFFKSGILKRKHFRSLISIQQKLMQSLADGEN